MGLVQASVFVPSMFMAQGTADPLPAGTAEGQSRVDLILDVDQRVQHHRTAFVEVYRIFVQMRVFHIVRRPAVDFENLGALGPGSGFIAACLP